MHRGRYPWRWQGRHRRRTFNGSWGGEPVRALNVVVLWLMVLVASCAPAAPTPSSPAGPASQASQPTSPRVLTASIPIEPTYIAALAPLPPGGASDFYQRMFNAFLDLYDDQ